MKQTWISESLRSLNKLTLPLFLLALCFLAGETGKLRKLEIISYSFSILFYCYSPNHSNSLEAVISFYYYYNDDA